MITLLAAFLSVQSLLAAEPSGYVVKVDAGAVYLDIGEGPGVEAGREFTVFTEGEELKHPISGESLGRLETTVGKGRIESVHPKFSVGQLTDMKAAAAPGQKFRLQHAPPVPPTASAPVGGVGERGLGERGARERGLGVRQPVWRSPVMDLEAVSIAWGDADGDGKGDIILASEDQVLVLPAEGAPSPDEPWKAVCSHQAKGTGVRYLSIDAMDVNGDGRTEVFASLYNSFFNRTETQVLDCKGGAFTVAATVPWLARSFQDESGTPRLASQELMSDKTFPFGDIRLVEYKDGKYVQAKDAFRRKRLEWIYSFTLAEDARAKAPFHLTYTSTNRIRAQFAKGAWATSETYGQTPVRVRWHDKLLQFSPRILAGKEGGRLSGIYAVKNQAGLGGLAGPFGVYASSELHRLRWNGMSFDADWATAPLGGYTADAAAPFSNDGKPEGILVAVVASGGKTSVLKFLP